MNHYLSNQAYRFNFGRRKNDPVKDRKALATYVELKGYKNGEHGDKLCQNGTAKSSLDEIAKELNMSKRNLQRVLRIEGNLTDSKKELKINPELRDFIPPLSGEEKKQLEDSLLKYGYKGAPIYIWNDFIVDGHNRYELCKKHNIEYPVEELLLGNNATIIDVMEWMINTQLGRRNLPPAQRLAVMDKFKKKIQEQAAKKANELRSKFHGNQYTEVSSPNGDHTKIKTDKELAKMAGVGTGTVARFNKVMNSDDESRKDFQKQKELIMPGG